MAGGNYAYPLDSGWSTEELIAVTNLYQVVEDAYEIGVSRSKILKAYADFKKVVSSKAFEKQLSRQFAKVSGYEIYQVVRRAQTSENSKIKMEG